MVLDLQTPYCNTTIKLAVNGQITNGAARSAKAASRRDGRVAAVVVERAAVVTAFGLLKLTY